MAVSVVTSMEVSRPNSLLKFPYFKIVVKCILLFVGDF